MKGCGGGISNLRDLDDRQPHDFLALRVLRPFLVRQHDGGDGAVVGESLLELERIPLRDRGDRGLVRFFAAEHVERGLLVVGQSGVEADESVVRGSIELAAEAIGLIVPGHPRDQRVPFRAECGGGMTDVDRHRLRSSGALTPDLGDGDAGGADRRCGGGPDTQDRGELRIGAGDGQSTHQSRIESSSCQQAGGGFCRARASLGYQRLQLVRHHAPGLERLRKNSCLTAGR